MGRQAPPTHNSPATHPQIIETEAKDGWTDSRQTGLNTQGGVLVA